MPDGLSVGPSFLTEGENKGKRVGWSQGRVEAVLCFFFLYFWELGGGGAGRGGAGGEGMGGGEGDDSLRLKCTSIQEVNGVRPRGLSEIRKFC